MAHIYGKVTPLKTLEIMRWQRFLQLSRLTAVYNLTWEFSLLLRLEQQGLRPRPQSVSSYFEEVTVYMGHRKRDARMAESASNHATQNVKARSTKKFWLIRVLELPNPRLYFGRATHAQSHQVL
jgi:hypothetical protein